jgi:hypothetical protein
MCAMLVSKMAVPGHGCGQNLGIAAGHPKLEVSRRPFEVIQKIRPRRRRWKGINIFLFAALFLMIPSSLPAAKRKTKPAAVEDIGDLPKPQLLNADTNPTLRYPAASFSGWSVFSTSYGWFDVTKDGVRYTPVEPKGKLDEGFESPFADISDVQLKYAYLYFKTSRKKRTVFYMSQDRWGSIHSGPGAMQAAAAGAPGTSSMLRAMKNFSAVLAAVKPPPPPEPQLTFQAEPATVQKGKPVTLVWTSMNSTTVELEPGDKTMPTQGTLSLTPAETTTYTLVAKGPGGSKSASAMVNVTEPPPSAPPTIILVEPSAAPGQAVEVSSSTLKIRGVAMDATGFPIVSINGTAANMRPQNAEAAEFWTDPVALQPGDNKFEIVAVNRGQVKATLSFVADYKPPPPPPAAAPAPNPKALGKQDILDLLKNFVPSARVADLVKQYGLKFSPTEDDLKDIQNAGGDDQLVGAIRDAAQKAGH